MDECRRLIGEVLMRNFPSIYNDSTAAIVFILTLALRSILKETYKLNNSTIQRLRNAGFFHVATMVTSWNFKISGKM